MTQIILHYPLKEDENEEQQVVDFLHNLKNTGLIDFLFPNIQSWPELEISILFKVKKELKFLINCKTLKTVNF